MRATRTQEPDAKVFLGEIHEFEEQRECHRLIQRFHRRQSLNARREFFGGSGFARTTVLRETAKLLDAVKRLASFQSLDQRTEAGAESANLGAQLG